MNHQAPQHLYVFSLGVAQLINKKEGKVFDEYDEQLFEVTIFLRCWSSLTFSSAFEVQ